MTCVNTCFSNTCKTLFKYFLSSRVSMDILLALSGSFRISTIYVLCGIVLQTLTHAHIPHTCLAKDSVVFVQAKKYLKLLLFTCNRLTIYSSP